MKAEVRKVNGKPELFINNELASRMWGRAALPSVLGPEKVEQYAPAGIQIYFTALDAQTSVGWNGADEYEFRPYEVQLDRLIRAKPDILLIPYLGWAGGSPYRWCKAHPEELTLSHKGKRLQTASLASDLWLEESTEAVRRFVDHFEHSRFKENIIGYNPIWNANEWFSHHRRGSEEFGWPDYSRPMRLLFRRWLRERYENDVEALRESWEDPKVDFETAELPTVEERLGHRESFFPEDGGTWNKVIDYYQCYDERLARVSVHYCRVIKETLPTPKLTGMMFAYSYCGRHDSKILPHHHGHGMAPIALKSEWVDFFHSPYHYYHRSFGGVHYSHHATETVLLHGKLMVDQIDTKSHLRLPPNRNADTPWETEQILKRDVAHSLSKNCQCYWLEGGPGPMFPIVPHHPKEWSPLWYDAPDILQTIKEMKRLKDENQQADTHHVSEIALITSNEATYYRKPETVFGNLFVEAFRQWILPEVGAPFDDYMLEDFAHIEKAYKVYFFVNAHYMPADLREKVRRKLERENATAVWFYAPGYIDETGRSLESIEALTGFKIAASDSKGYLQINLQEANHPYLEGVEIEDFGSDTEPGFFQRGLKWLTWPQNKEDYKFTPRFYAEDADSEVLGTLRGVEKPGFVVKDLDGMRSVYLSAPLVPASIVRNIVSEAGVHLYSRTGDLIYANSGYVAFCSRGAGRKTLRLPRSCDVYEALTGKQLGQDVKEISFEAPHGQTRFFRLE